MDSELPGYSPPLPPPSQSAGSSANTAQAGSQHLSSLEDSKGYKWLSLTVSSRAPNPASLPCFYQGDIISGQVDLDVLKSESIKAITIKVTAGTTLVGQEEDTFLKMEKELWTPSMPLPDGSKVSKFGKGKYLWPFSLALPTEVQVQDQKVIKKFPLPATFSERASAGYLDYKLIVTVKRGTFRVNQILHTNFAYVPLTRPEPPSRMLQKAYKEGLPLIGPEGDPDGWHVLYPITIQGKIFDLRQVEVVFGLAFAKPVTLYARGTAIPLWLTLTGDDEQALDLLSSPKVIKLLMVRSLATGVDATNDDVEKRTDNCFLENVARGVFWAPEDASAPGKRVLQGEVDVKKSFKPSTQFPKFTIRVRWFLLDTKTSFTIDIVIFDICSIIWNYNLSRHMVSSL
ncbi:hypothetical protein PAXINDRAFT_117723 [Paxillus involutus ATCC 200175]|uniref:Arrestin-like N-terminal domain-containing protein n=1 Tax=Paxillus involutus ATCC 200175 TaxID=664439 RepID=A0A0C9TB23_PAXIN|nr:hypothetical protein PAXINDRAFT_117723 [Paxillus involutus ATCC 200175]